MLGCIKRRSRPRRGRVIDKARIAWVHTLPCAIAGKHVCVLPITAHHVRNFGSPKDDTRILPLCCAAHFHGVSKDAIEHGKRQFEKRFDVDIEELVAKYQRMYEQQKRVNHAA